MKDFAILGIIAFNSFLGLMSSYFIYKAFEELIIHEDISKKLCLLLIIGINPAILKIGITGLEYSLIVLFISLLFLYVSKDKNNYLLLISAAFIPIARIELIAVNLDKIQFSTLQYSRALDSSVLYITVQCSAVRCCTLN